MLTGVSAGGSLAPGRSGWALPWRQLEHLQVPLLILSAARGMQSKGEGSVASQTQSSGRPEGSSKTPFPFTDGETKARAGSGQSHSGRARPASHQESQGCPICAPSGMDLTNKIGVPMVLLQ